MKIAKPQDSKITKGSVFHGLQNEAVGLIDTGCHEGQKENG